MLDKLRLSRGGKHEENEEAEDISLSSISFMSLDGQDVAQGGVSQALGDFKNDLLGKRKWMMQAMHGGGGNSYSVDDVYDELDDEDVVKRKQSMETPESVQARRAKSTLNLLDQEQQAIIQFEIEQDALLEDADSSTQADLQRQKSFNKKVVYKYTACSPERRMLAKDVDLFGGAQEYWTCLVDALLKAQDTIFIVDWCLSPEVFLKRDTLPLDPRYRLDNLLRARAEQGVEIYVMIFDAPSPAGLAPDRVVRVLNDLHQNVHAMAHSPAELSDIYYSHHQKFVCVDTQVAFLGGIDLCYGRYDEPDHPVVGMFFFE